MSLHTRQTRNSESLEKKYLQLVANNVGAYKKTSYKSKLSTFSSNSSQKSSSIYMYDSRSDCNYESDDEYDDYSSNSSFIKFNMRNLSYLTSKQDDCIDALIFRMNEQAKKDAEKKTDAKSTVIEEVTRVKKSKFSLCLDGAQKAITENRIYKKLFEPIDSQSKKYLLWLAIVSISYIYNMISIPLRYSFEVNYEGSNSSLKNESNKNFTDQTVRLSDSNQSNITFVIHDNLTSAQFDSDLSDQFSTINYRTFRWIFSDLICDIIYLMDIFLVQTKIRFIKEGLWVSDIKSTSLNYLKSGSFIIDIISIIPFDVLNIFLTTYNHLTRLNRCIRVNSLWEFFDRWDRSVESYAFVVRLIRLFTYLQIIIHLYACVYFKISLWEIVELKIRNEWVYDFQNSNIDNYIHSYFFGLKTASTIGNYVQPITKYEYLFTAISYVIALFLFALIVGQIRNIIASLSTKQDSFLIVLDMTIKYIKMLNLTDELKNKTILWFDYFSREQISHVPFEAISFLPVSIQTDIAINIYYDLLSKVKLFQGCEKNILYSLVLKLKPIIFMPGDYICRKNDVGREMFIVDKGIVEVVVNGKAVAQMKEGSYFGEISLLSMGEGGNRRTASIVSKGFSKLFVLLKSDLNEVLSNYPELEETLRKAADGYLKKK